MILLTNDGLRHTSVDRKDVLLYQLHRARSLSDLLVEVVSQTSPFELHLRGLQRGLRLGL